MKTYLPLVGCAVALWLAGCAAQQPIATGKMEPEVRALIEQRRIEPGFTPEMVFLALGKPQTPAEGLAVPDTKPGSLAARLWRKAGGG